MAFPVPKAKLRKIQTSRKTNCKLESIPHNPRPGGGLTSLCCRKLSKIPFLKRHGANTDTSIKRQCTHLYMSEIPSLPSGDTHAVNMEQSTVSIRLAGFWSGGTQPSGKNEETESTALLLEREGKGSSSGKRVCRTCQSSTGGPGWCGSVG